MSCDVYVYNNTMAPESGTFIEILERDHWGVSIDIQMSSRLGPSEYGAKLKAPSPARPVNVYVDDNSNHFAATSLGHLNGKLPIRLDVTLYPLPKGSGRLARGSGGGGGRLWHPAPHAGVPLTPAQIVAFIHRQVTSGFWTQEEATGVRILVETVMRALNCPSRDPDFQRRLDRWCKLLENLGISTSSFHFDPQAGPFGKPELRPDDPEQRPRYLGY